jgi:ABC-type multidrug transport system ATPase subunit
MNNPNHPAPLLQLDRVGRRAAGRDLVRDLNLGVARGQTLGLLGVNGAGKTTTLRMIAGVLAPSAGASCSTARICTNNPDSRAAASATCRKRRRCTRN